MGTVVTPVVTVRMQAFRGGTHTENRLSVRPPKNASEYRQVLAETAIWLDAEEYHADGDLAAAVFRLAVEVCVYYTELVSDGIAPEHLRIADFSSTLQGIGENLDMRAVDYAEPMPVDTKPKLTPERLAEVKSLMHRAITEGDLQLALTYLKIQDGDMPDLAEWEQELLRPGPSNPELWV